MTTIAEPAVLEVQGVSKRFAGVVALDDVSLELRPGEVHALVGENGAGKSTLIKVLTGVYQPDSGRVMLSGRTGHVRPPARRAGRRDQHDLPGGQPGAAGERREEPLPRARADQSPRPDRLRADARSGRRRASPATASTSTSGDPSASSVSACSRWSRSPARSTRTHRVVIMDEPTSSLEPREVEQLIDVVDLLRRDGVAVVYVSHRLDEVFRLCDTVTVLRDGRRVHTGPVAEITRLELVVEDARSGRRGGRPARGRGSRARHVAGRRVLLEGHRPDAPPCPRRRLASSAPPARSSGWPVCSDPGERETAKAIYGAQRARRRLGRDRRATRCALGSARAAIAAGHRAHPRGPQGRGHHPDAVRSRQHRAGGAADAVARRASSRIDDRTRSSRRS